MSAINALLQRPWLGNDSSGPLIMIEIGFRLVVWVAIVIAILTGHPVVCGARLSMDAADRLSCSDARRSRAGCAILRQASDLTSTSAGTTRPGSILNRALFYTLVIPSQIALSSILPAPRHRVQLLILS
jgi:hypothetical protein